METSKRTLVKAFTWQISGLFVMILITWLFTGSVNTSIGVAILSCMSGIVFYVLHEKVWQRVAWGLKKPFRIEG
ncbi:DUF2061 domain-containing protein [Sneathiella sp.]|jgi:uncharacterized membrane protein|uniref:DUF2061 domain-containing protein n=1 Tax=Sneathiella sp. TaxID=1964365 RepID=UPI0039E5E181